MAQRQSWWMSRALVTAASAACLAGCGPTAAPPRPATADAHGDHGHAAAHGHDHEHDHKNGHDHDHGHDEHEHPDTLAAGIAELESFVGDIAAKLASGDSAAADDAVHGLGHLLEEVQGLLEKSTLAADARTAAGKAVDELFECFDELDTALHAAPGKADPPAEVHGRLKDRIDAAAKALKEVAR